MQDQPIGPNPSGLCMCGCGEKTNISPKAHAKFGYVKGQPRRYLHGHRHRADKPTFERYEVEDHGHSTPCWIWQGHLDRAGYGRCVSEGQLLSAHRAFYEHHVAPIPEGLHIDHLCRVHACVNPAHLEPVTPAENNRRASLHITHCPHGHPYDEANTGINTRGARVCLTCRRAQQRVYDRERRIRVGQTSH